MTQHAHQHLKLNDLPEHARERLTEMREHHFFTSDLSVNEFLLVKEAGFHPLGLVMGSSIYHIGFEQVKAGKSQELSKLTQALYSARELAMARLEEEADALNADGVVAMRLTLNIHAWGANVIEFVALGTAVKSERGAGFRGAQDRPFTSDLSGQDFWTLLEAGYRPLGFVMGNCVYYIGDVPTGQPTESNELLGATQGLYDARALDAAGIVGVTIDENNHTWGPSVLEFSAVGTAVLAISDDHHIPKPGLVLTVR